MLALIGGEAGNNNMEKDFDSKLYSEQFIIVKWRWKRAEIQELCV